MNETTTYEGPATASFGVVQPAQLKPGQDFVQYLKDYARERPEVAAAWCLGVGFILGWKLKPW